MGEAFACFATAFSRLLACSCWHLQTPFLSTAFLLQALTCRFSRFLSSLRRRATLGARRWSAAWGRCAVVTLCCAGLWSQLLRCAVSCDAMRDVPKMERRLGQVRCAVVMLCVLCCIIMLRHALATLCCAHAVQRCAKSSIRLPSHYFIPRLRRAS